MRLANWQRADGKLASGKIANLKRAKGFTLIELMIVVAIIGILSMIGIPAYNDYVTRGKLVDATSKLADMRIQLEQYYQDNRNYGSTSSACGIAMPASKYFTISCKWGTSGNDQSYKITATGTINKTSFTYTIDETNTKTTTSGWGNGNTCWITRKGDSC
jgi:type IV pilus assembly protein PilE